MPDQDDAQHVNCNMHGTPAGRMHWRASATGSAANHKASGIGTIRSICWPHRRTDVSHKLGQKHEAYRLSAFRRSTSCSVGEAGASLRYCTLRLSVGLARDTVGTAPRPRAHAGWNMAKMLRATMIVAAAQRCRVVQEYKADLRIHSASTMKDRPRALNELVSISVC